MRQNILSRIEVLENLVRRLERTTFEGKKDQEILNNFLGDDYYSKYQDIRNKIKDPDYKDIYKLIKKDPDEVKNYIDNFQSNTDIRKAKKSEGAELIYKDNLWKVYRITTYPAAQLYGSGTTWCITGRYDGHESRGEEYFNKYIDDNDLDGGYYFYIKNDGKTKFCLLRKNDGRIHSIWNAADEQLDTDDIVIEDKEFPTVPGIFTTPSYEEVAVNPFSDNVRAVQSAINNGYDLNKPCDNKEKPYYGYTPLEWQYRARLYNMKLANLLLDNGAKVTNKMPWQNLFLYLPESDLLKYLNAGIADVHNVSLEEMLEYAIDNSSIGHAKVLLKKGADPNKPMSDGKPAIYHELTRKYDARLSVLKELVKKGAKVDEEVFEFAKSIPSTGAALMFLYSIINK